MPNDEYECQFCGRGFSHSRDRDEHERLCGVSRLSDYGIDTETLQKMRDAEIETSGSSSKQLQLDEMPVGCCPVCGQRILESDTYKELDDYYVCRNCEKVIYKNNM